MRMSRRRLSGVRKQAESVCSQAGSDDDRMPAVGEEMATETYVRLNIGGTSYRIRSQTVLRRGAHTLLGRFVQASHAGRVELADDYFDDAREFYFERSPQLFEPVFKFYATGALHRSPELCQEEFLDEIAYWGIAVKLVAPCCAADLIPLADAIAVVDSDEFDGQCCADQRRHLWTFLQGTESTRGTRAFEIASSAFVFVSILGLTLSSIPSLQVLDEEAARDNITVNGQPKKITSPTFEYLEKGCVAWFTVELALRFFAAPQKLRFVVQLMNVVDMLAIFPFYLDIVLYVAGVDDNNLEDFSSAFLVVRVLRVLRVIRIIKLGRFSSGLQTFALTLQRSQKQLQMMAVVLLTGVVFFSTLIYFLEKDSPSTPFDSIPSAYWWCIVTMTTVGYGDVVPSTVIGKMVASMAIMCGVLVLALPITIIVDNFIKVAQMEAGLTVEGSESRRNSLKP